MKRSTIVALALALAVPSVALACEGKYKQQASFGPKKATVAQASKWNSSRMMTAVDANDTETRQKEGVIPGAVMLTSATRYDVQQLPANKDTKLVFYCYNDMCRASEAAATRALAAGYTDVAVMDQGIMGWKAAGGAVVKPNS